MDIFKDKLQHDQIFGKAILTTDQPIPRETVPDGWFCYDMRGTDSDGEENPHAPADYGDNGMKMGGMGLCIG